MDTGVMTGIILPYFSYHSSNFGIQVNSTPNSLQLEKLVFRECCLKKKYIPYPPQTD